MKNMYRRFLSLVLCMCMVFVLLPNIAMPAYAANSGTVIGLADESIGLSFSGDADNAWSASGTQIVGSATGTGGTCSDTHYSSTLTITNTRTTKATLSFDYTIALNSGTIQVDGAAVTAGGKFSKELASNASIKVYIKSGSTSAATTITMTNVKLVADVSATVTFQPAQNGSYTVDGKAINEDYTNTQSSMTAYQVVATPAAGYQFMGWYNVTERKYINTSPKAALNIESDCTITARFVSNDAALFETGGQRFDDLNDAIREAQKKLPATIALVSSGAIAGSYTIPSGVTLLIPFDEAKTCYTTTPAPTTSQESAKVFRTLTMSEGASLTVNGAISVGGQYYAAPGGGQGHIVGPYGYIKMESGSTIDVKSGGALYAWGFVSGSGAVTVQSGGSVYEWYQILDFRGGTASSKIGNKVFPFNQYAVQNVEVPLTLHAGASETVYSGVNAVGGIKPTSIPFIGNNGMFKLNSGTLTKAYDGATDRIIYTIDGVAELNSLSLKLAGISVNSKDYVLPLTNNMTIDLAEGGKLTINQTAALLPGVEVSIAKDAELMVSKGTNIYIYDVDEWGGYCSGYSKQFIPVVYAPGRTGSRAPLADVKVDVNGTLTASGGIYTTASGADICSSEGTGVYNQQGAPGTETKTYQYDGGPTKHDIPITAAKLHNADGSFTETQTAKAGDTINYVRGVWGGEPCRHPNTELRGAKDATCTTTGYTGDSYCDVCGVLLKKGEVIPKSGAVITWVVNGTQTTQVYEKGKTPTFPGTPEKPETARYRYVFAGWDQEIVPVTSDATYTAQFTQVGKNGLCVEGADTYWIANGENVAFPGLIRINVGSEAQPHYHYYYFGEDGKAVKNGNYKVDKNNDLPLPAYQYCFDADGVIIHDDDTSKNGICPGDGSKYYYVDGVKVGEGLICVDGTFYYARTSNGEIVRDRDYWIEKTNGYPIEAQTYHFDADGKMVIDGFVDINGGTYYFVKGECAKGLTKIGEDYYFFNAASGLMYKDANMWVPANDYGVEPGMHYFDAEGKMFVPNVETGVKKIVAENGKLYFTIDGVKMVNGLYELDGAYYFARYDGTLVTNGSAYVETSLLSGNGWYGFGADGKLIKTGFVTGNGKTYYYADGVRAKGLTKIGEDYYFFNAGSGMMYKDANMWVPANSYGVEPGMHYFDADGKMFVPDTVNGKRAIVAENGKLYFTIDGVKMVNGLYELDGAYYFARYDGTLVTNGSAYVETSLLSGNGWYGFGADGKLIKTGFVTGNGKTYYYADGVRAKGLTKIGEDYYFFNAGSGMMYKDANMWVPANSYGVEPGMHSFGADGKMAQTAG